MNNKNNKFKFLGGAGLISSLFHIPLFSPILRFSDSPIQTSSATLAPSSSSPSSSGILDICRLKVSFFTEEGEVCAVNDVNFFMRRGKVMALVGESGCGKSVTAFSILRLIQKPGKIMGGEILFRPSGEDPVDIMKLGENSNALFNIRGGKISMIFQEPMTALSPVHTIGNQICEAILIHQNVSKADAERKAVDMLRKVGIPGAEQRLAQYPFEMSGGMRQRAMIAMALVCNPEILIADEPTTALDVTIQAQIMFLMKKLQKELGTSILLITHDLGVVAQMADDVAVMYLGRIVEQGDVRTIVKRPLHPYTMGLIASLPGLSADKERLHSIKGSVPSLTSIPQGCPFHPRCEYYKPGLCDVGKPPVLEEIEAGHSAACLRVKEIREEKKRSE
ncbi:MAG: ABC transporter ATP-binding protein [Victivallales bacterium]